MNLDFSDRKIMAAGLVLLVVAAGLGIFWIVDTASESPITKASASGSFAVEVIDYNLDNGEEITETDADSAG